MVDKPRQVKSKRENGGGPKMECVDEMDKSFEKTDPNFWFKMTRTTLFIGGGLRQDQFN